MAERLDDVGGAYERRDSDMIGRLLSNLPQPFGFLQALGGRTAEVASEGARQALQQAGRGQRGEEFDISPIALQALGATGAPVLGPARTLSTLGAGLMRRVAGGGSHPISDVILARPVSEMQAAATYRPAALQPVETPITPAQLQGGMLLPAFGDRSVAGQILTGVGGTRLETAVPLQGGHGYMATPGGGIWASAPEIVSRIEGAAGKAAEKGPVYFPYTAMGPQSIDFSHHMTDTLSEMMKRAPVSSRSAGQFNEKMRETVTKDLPQGVPDFPGVKSPRLKEYLQDAPGSVKNRFAGMMDKREMQNLGFPSVAEARVATTDPRLTDVPWGASGLAISRITPGVPRPAPIHGTSAYGAGLPGEYVGSFGLSVPPEVMYPDTFGSLARSMAGQPGSRIQRAFSLKLPAQPANQSWVDTVSAYMRSKGMLPAVAGAVAAPTLADIGRE
jgi:hypothetical protein